MPTSCARPDLFHLRLAVVLVCGLGAGAAAAAADLSPQHWPQEARVAAEQAELTSPSPLTARTVSSRAGLVVSTLSPIAALAGTETLKAGGNAADAAIATALTQITTALGTNISYAGILEAVYYDARTHRAYALNAGWNAWSGETERSSIPLSPTLSTLLALQGSGTSSAAAADGGVQRGRRTLVPGFMAGIGALHARFGRLKLQDLFAPAIHYAQHGVSLSPGLRGYFGAFAPYLAATPEGRRFMLQAGGEPQAGGRFVQSELAATLRAVARHGAGEMYSGRWARDFVAAVNAAGGKASLQDLERYQVTWSEPASRMFQGDEIRISPSTVGGPMILETLAMIENTGLLQRPAYTHDADALLALSRILAWSSAAQSAPQTLEAFRAAGVDVTLAGRQSPAYAAAVMPALRTLFLTPGQQAPPLTLPHSASVVVVDSQGNVASMVHTSNTLAWGSTGLIVDGIPIPDAAGLTSVRFPDAKPGGRIPHDMAPLIAFKEGKPVLAVATVGSSLVPSTVQLLVDVLAGGRDLDTALAAPPLLLSGFQSQPPSLILQVPAGAYSAELVAQLRAEHVTLKECNTRETVALRGTAAVARLDGDRVESAEVPGVFNFAAEVE